MDIHGPISECIDGTDDMHLDYIILSCFRRREKMDEWMERRRIDRVMLTCIRIH